MSSHVGKLGRGRCAATRGSARLAGVTRAELQRRIRRGDIPTFEGAVTVNDLLRAYPSVSLTDDAALERVERIKNEALPKTNERDAVLPSAQVLVSRLRMLSESLAERISALGAAESLLRHASTMCGERTERTQVMRMPV